MFENKASEVLKIISLFFVNDWFQNKHNEVIGYYRQALVTTISYADWHAVVGALNNCRHNSSSFI